MQNTCSRILLTGIVLLGSAANAAEDVSFTRDIRPLLSNACFHCHGPDGNTREADLRLDRRDGLFGTDAESGVVEPRHPDRSELIRRILSNDPDEMMPPPAANKPLSAAQRQLLVAWVQQGAAWEEHWAFVTPREPSVPELRSDWGRNEIDAFILQRLQRSGLQPAPDAQPDALLRRLYLDLIGVPPEPADVDRWRAQIWPAGTNVDENAYQRLIDELLASPHYGERWARRWLDLARYADTNGYEKDRDRTMWPYRDWVVSAINSGMPFDEFTIQQLAGDMLPAATVDQRIATGFHRNTMLNEEGGIDPLEFRFHAMTDRVATTGTTWLGLTLGCCQCHTHKYDPISHREYYGMMAYLNNADEPALELPDESIAAQSRANKQRVAELIAALPQRWPDDDAQQTPALEAAYAAWLQAEQAHAVSWEVLVPVEATSNLPLLTIQDDHSIFASGDTAKRDDYVVKLAPSSQPVTALRLEALPDSRLPHGGPGSTYYEGTLGDFFLTDLRATGADRNYPFASATETYARNRFGKNPAFARLAIDDDIQTGWSVHQRQGERHVAVFQFREPVPPGTELTIHMTFGRHFASSLGRFRFSATGSATQPHARTYDATVAAEIRAAASAAADQPPPKDATTTLTPALRTFLLQAPQLKKHTAEIRRLSQPLKQVTALVFSERPPNNPRPTFRHHRGEYLSPREQVSATIPQVIRSDGDALPNDRLGLARWLVSGANPLTARVTINREWAAFFGTGLVRTLDDFGLQGEPPSHPELLDWLAVTFVERDGWSLRSLHRRIVSSSVYRQSVQATPAAVGVDPDNRLLSSAPRFRLDAEVLRDQFLAAASILNRKIGGPPVRPLQPAGVTEVAYGSPKWNVSDGDQKYRRSLYTYAKRTAPFAMFGTFDAPSGESCVARRNRSNSPLQALTLLNDVMLVDIARHAGAYATELKAKSDDRTTLTDLFRRLLVRVPDEAELHRLLTFAAARREDFRQHPETARAFLQLSAEAPLDEQTISHAVWTSVARALFSLDEALVRP